MGSVCVAHMCVCVWVHVNIHVHAYLLTYLFSFFFFYLLFMYCVNISDFSLFLQTLFLWLLSQVAARVLIDACCLREGPIFQDFCESHRSARYQTSLRRCPKWAARFNVCGVCVSKAAVLFNKPKITWFFAICTFCTLYIRSVSKVKELWSQLSRTFWCMTRGAGTNRSGIRSESKFVQKKKLNNNIWDNSVFLLHRSAHVELTHTQTHTQTSKLFMALICVCVCVCSKLYHFQAGLMGWLSALSLCC